MFNFGVSGSLIGLVVVVVLLVAVLGWGISTYNRLIREREMIRNAMGQIAAQIESRWDALRSLIDATRFYAGHEADVMMQTTQSRSQITSQSSVAAVEQDNALFSRAMADINAVAEAYPDLKAAAVTQDAMASIDRYEQQVRQSRMVYNDTVTRFNRTVQSVPSNIIAGLFHFTQEVYFENAPEKQNMPSWNDAQ